MIDETKTRYTRNTPSKSTRWLADYFNKKKIKDILMLDFGAGKGRNSVFLLENPEVTIIPYDINKPSDSFYNGNYLVEDDLSFVESVSWHYIICNFVLNVLTKEKRSSIIKILDTLIWKYLIIEVRSIGEIERTKHEKWIKFDDGWLTTKKTFQRGFSAQQILKLPFSKIKRKSVIVDGEAIGVLFERKN